MIFFKKMFIDSFLKVKMLQNIGKRFDRMTLWMVRAGEYGEREDLAINKNIVIIGWEDLPDLSTIHSREELVDLYAKTYPDSKKMTAANQVGQLWRFIHEMQIDDLIALPLKKQSAIIIGKIKSNYEYRKIDDSFNHTRQVAWIKTIPRSAFDQDLLYSFGAYLTVCQIERNDAEERVKKLLEKETYEPVIEISKEEAEEKIDIETYAQDIIIKYIDRKFKGHSLARLADAVLKAQGYITFVSPPGPDGGVDILASAGPLGFDRPRICVQVKSSSSPIDVRVFRELRGIMAKYKAEQGLLISWAGFNSKVLQEAKDDFFEVRFWDSGELLNEIFKYYDKFNDELKAELPLKRIMALVLEEE
jgi:restriction system protein